MDLTALKVAIEGDARFAADLAAGNDGKIAAALNAPDPLVRVRRRDVRPAEIIGALRPADLAGLSQPERDWLNLMARMETIDGESVRDVLAGLTLSAASRTRLLAVIHRDGSRAEELWGRETVPLVDEVSRALHPEKLDHPRAPADPMVWVHSCLHSWHAHAHSAAVSACYVGQDDIDRGLPGAVRCPCVVTR